MRPLPMMVLLAAAVLASTPAIAQERVGTLPRHDSPDALTPLLTKSGLLEPMVPPIGSEAIGKSIPVQVVGGKPAQGGGLASVKVIRLTGSNSAVPTEYKAPEVKRLTVDDRIFVYDPKARALMPLVGHSPGGTDTPVYGKGSVVPRTGDGNGGGSGRGGGSSGGGGGGSSGGGRGGGGGGGNGGGGGAPVGGGGGGSNGDGGGRQGMGNGGGMSPGGNPGGQNRLPTTVPGLDPEPGDDFPVGPGGRTRSGGRGNPGQATDTVGRNTRNSAPPVTGRSPTAPGSGTATKTGGSRSVGGLGERSVAPSTPVSIAMGQTPTFTLASMGGGDGGPRVIRGADATPQPSGETPMSARAIVPAPARGAGAAASRTSSSDPSRPDAVAFVVHRRPRPGTADDRDQQLYINDVWVAALPDGERVQVSLPARADNAYQVRLMLSNSPGGGDTHAIRAKPGEEVIVETDMKAGDGDPCRIVKDQLKVRPAGQADPGDPR